MKSPIEKPWVVFTWNGVYGGYLGIARIAEYQDDSHFSIRLSDFNREGEVERGIPINYTGSRKNVRFSRYQEAVKYLVSQADPERSVGHSKEELTQIVLKTVLSDFPESTRKEPHPRRSVTNAREVERQIRKRIRGW